MGVNIDDQCAVLLRSLQVLISIVLLLIYRDVECKEPLEQWLVCLCLIITIDAFLRRYQKAIKYLSSCFVVIWCIVGKIMMEERYSDDNRDVYILSNWYSFMLNTTMIYQFIPGFAYILVILLIIISIPLVSWFDVLCFALSGIQMDSTTVFESIYDSMFEQEVTDCRSQRLSQIPIVSFEPVVNNDIERDEYGQETECGICLAMYSERDKLRLLPCLHRFHVDCVDSWLMKTGHCPMCRMYVI